MIMDQLWYLPNMFLATSTLMALVAELSLSWRTLDKRRLYLMFGLLGFVFTVLVGGAENLLHNNEVGVRTAFATASCLWCLIGLWVGRRDEMSPVNKKR